MGTIKVEVELPEELLLTARISKEHASEELKRLVAFELYRRGTISLGKACEDTVRFEMKRGGSGE